MSSVRETTKSMFDVLNQTLDRPEVPSDDSLNLGATPYPTISTRDLNPPTKKKARKSRSEEPAVAQEPAAPESTPGLESRSEGAPSNHASQVGIPDGSPTQSVRSAPAELTGQLQVDTAEDVFDGNTLPNAASTQPIDENAAPVQLDVDGAAPRRGPSRDTLLNPFKTAGAVYDRFDALTDCIFRTDWLPNHSGGKYLGRVITLLNMLTDVTVGGGLAASLFIGHLALEVTCAVGLAALYIGGVAGATALKAGGALLGGTGGLALGMAEGLKGFVVPKKFSDELTARDNVLARSLQRGLQGAGRGWNVLNGAAPRQPFAPTRLNQQANSVYEALTPNIQDRIEKQAELAATTQQLQQVKGMLADIIGPIADGVNEALTRAREANKVEASKIGEIGDSLDKGDWGAVLSGLLGTANGDATEIDRRLPAGYSNAMLQTKQIQEQLNTAFWTAHSKACIENHLNPTKLVDWLAGNTQWSIPFDSEWLAQHRVEGLRGEDDSTLLRQIAAAKSALATNTLEGEALQEQIDRVRNGIAELVAKPEELSKLIAMAMPEFWFTRAPTCEDFAKNMYFSPSDDADEPLQPKLTLEFINQVAGYDSTAANHHDLAVPEQVLNTTDDDASVGAESTSAASFVTASDGSLNNAEAQVGEGAGTAPNESVVTTPETQGTEGVVAPAAQDTAQASAATTAPANRSEGDFPVVAKAIYEGLQRRTQQ